jgi:hypothetical protein
LLAKRDWSIAFSVKQFLANSQLSGDNCIENLQHRKLARMLQFSTEERSAILPPVFSTSPISVVPKRGRRPKKNLDTVDST